MRKLIIFFVFSINSLSAQPYYTPLRAAVGVEAFGTAPQRQVCTEVMFGYKSRSFLALQAGLGLYNISDYTTYSISAALTYNFLLNRYRKKECQPHPGHNVLESYFEVGTSAFLFDKYVNVYFPPTDQQEQICPLALAGLRFHIVSTKWIYILKIRYTPSLVDSKVASVGGVAVGFGWR
ncbi:hypothetical protein [Dyadobacter sp. CY312]|uniref:hypothetical protein n=1 Tax=Dyadobacter sp. CY312 TaxID=2907303 RepID=UPI001F1F7521|nr:hypothetical protein [Dyadobacter sp. CY312]MCE7041297.1 hypothetical protein [Dyadobacter sp. CY312]